MKGDKEFFAKIWDNREHVCAECGCDLGDEPIAHFFAHIWSKGSNNFYRHDERNIILLCPDHHYELDNGDKTQMFIYDIVEETIMMLKNEYYSNKRY